MKKPTRAKKAKPWTKAEKRAMRWSVNGGKLPKALTLSAHDSVNLNPQTPEDIAKAKFAITSGVLPPGIFLDPDGLLHSKKKKLTKKSVGTATFTITVTAK